MSRLPDRREFRRRSNNMPWVAFVLSTATLLWLAVLAFAIWYIV